MERQTNFDNRRQISLQKNNCFIDIVTKLVWKTIKWNKKLIFDLKLIGLVDDHNSMFHTIRHWFQIFRCRFYGSFELFAWIVILNWVLVRSISKLEKLFIHNLLQIEYNMYYTISLWMNDGKYLLEFWNWQFLWLWLLLWRDSDLFCLHFAVNNTNLLGGQVNNSTEFK